MTSAHAPTDPADLTAAPESGIIHTEDLTKVYPGTDFVAVDKLNLSTFAAAIGQRRRDRWPHRFGHPRAFKSLWFAAN